MVVRKKREKGSLTLEACIVVPVFIMLMLVINGLSLVFIGQHLITHALCQSAKSLALDPYASQRITAEEEAGAARVFSDLYNYSDSQYMSMEKWYEQDSITDVVKKRFQLYLKPSDKAADIILEHCGVLDGLEGLDFSDSKVENGVLQLKVKFKQELAMNAFDMEPFDREMSVRVLLFQYKEVK